jgi:hypothetical protein
MNRFILLLCAACLACDGAITEPHWTTVQEFVDAERLPAAQQVQEVLRLDEQALVVFTVKFGELIRTRAGDYHDTAFGLELGENVGWLMVPGIQVDRARLRHYEVSPADEYLFTGDFAERLEAADDWIYHALVLPLLAASEHTPEATLLRIAGELTSFPGRRVASLLLDQPVVQANREILTLLANLPGPQYAEARLRAEELLRALD